MVVQFKLLSLHHTKKDNMKKDLIKQLKEEAQELIDFGNSKEKAEGHGMLKILNQIEPIKEK